MCLLILRVEKKFQTRHAAADEAFGTAPMAPLAANFRNAENAAADEFRFDAGLYWQPQEVFKGEYGVSRGHVGGCEEVAR